MKNNYFILFIAATLFLFGNHAFAQKTENPFSIK